MTVRRSGTETGTLKTRMGFLICNDLEVATRIVQTEPVSIGVADPKEKIRDLVLWSVSDEYFALREHLG